LVVSLAIKVEISVVGFIKTTDELIKSPSSMVQMSQKNIDQYGKLVGSDADNNIEKNSSLRLV
jgi:hypothetical protein